MDATTGTGIEKEMFSSTPTTVGVEDPFFDISYYYTASMKHVITRYVLLGGLD